MKKMAKEEVAIRRGGSRRGPEIETTDEVVSEDRRPYDIEEDVNALLGGEELSEEFREKAKSHL